tara:strand:- start:601 stop:858 length:258 start_codon:yes stop_codon:yes gene_type:complete
MKSYIFAKDVLSEKHIGSLVHVKEVFHSKSGKDICKEYDNCIIINLYRGLMLKCCIFLSNCDYLIYDLDSENIFLYVAFPEEIDD